MAHVIEIDYKDTAWKQVEQIKDANFDTGVVLG